MRAVGVIGGALCLALVAAACTRSPSASPASPAPGGEAVPTVTATEADRLVELRAGDQYLEFAEHERAATAPYARLAWENFAPIVDGERVEWANKAELWDSIAPKIRDEALLLGPEYRQPLWDNTNAIPNGVSMAWTTEDTAGRGHFAEFSVTYESDRGPARRYWGFLVVRLPDGVGQVSAAMEPWTFLEADFDGEVDEAEAVTAREWVWIEQQDAYR